MASESIIEKFGISHEVSILGISLYVFGLDIGGIFLASFMEGKSYIFYLCHYPSPFSLSHSTLLLVGP